MRALCIVTLLFACTLAIQFDVPNNAMRCVSEEYYEKEVIVGKYSFPAFAHLRMSVTITAPSGDVVWQKQDAMPEETFVFTALTDGQFKFCFSDTIRRTGAPGNPRRVTITAEEQQVNPDKDAVGAAKHTIKPIEYRLRVMEKQTDDLEVEFKRFREREARHRDTSESTNSRIPSLSAVTIISLLALGALQVYYLKSYFRKKKLL